MNDQHRTVVVDFIPTAENLAKWAFEQVDPHIKSVYGNPAKTRSYACRETPKSWATWKPY